MSNETAEQIDTRAALKVAIRALDVIASNVNGTIRHEKGRCVPEECPTHIADAARKEAAKLMGV